MERGLTSLQKATQLPDEAMELLDDEATLRGAKHFGATMYSVTHWAKFYTHHWYTASKACKFKKQNQQNVNAAEMEWTKQQHISSNAPTGTK